MTDCPNGAVRDLLPDLLHDRLTPAARREVEAHLRECAECRDELELLGALRESMSPAPAVDVARISAAIAPYRAPTPAPRRIGGVWRAAAAIVLLAGGAAVMRVALHRDVGTPRERVATTAPHTPAKAATPAAVPQAVATRRESTVARVAPTVTTPRATRELAMGASTTGELTERELSTLLENLESLDVVPSVDVENGPPSPLAPSQRGKS